MHSYIAVWTWYVQSLQKLELFLLLKENTVIEFLTELSLLEAEIRQTTVGLWVMFCILE